jgi:fatty acid desaturase
MKAMTLHQELGVPRWNFRLKGRTFAVKLVIYLGLILFGILLNSRGGWLCTTVSMLTLGAMFAHGVELQHQALHHIAFKSRKLNGIAGLLLGIPMLVSFSEYQKSHLWHHRKVGTSEDRESFDYDYESLRRPLGLVLHLFMLRHYWTKLGKLCKAILPARIGDLRDARIRAEHRLMLALLIIAVGLSIANHNAAVVRLWLAPLVLVAAPIHVLIELPEHLGCRSNSTEVFQNTRSIVAGRFSRWFTNGNNFHVEHHWHPGVQVENWPEMHRQLRAHMKFLEPSYWAFYRRFFTALRTRHAGDPNYWITNFPSSKSASKNEGTSL